MWKFPLENSDRFCMHSNAEFRQVSTFIWNLNYFSYFHGQNYKSLIDILWGHLQSGRASVTGHQYIYSGTFETHAWWINVTAVMQSHILIKPFLTCLISSHQIVSTVLGFYKSFNKGKALYKWLPFFSLVPFELATKCPLELAKLVLMQT